MLIVFVSDGQPLDEDSSETGKLLIVLSVGLAIVSLVLVWLIWRNYKQGKRFKSFVNGIDQETTLTVTVDTDSDEEEAPTITAMEPAPYSGDTVELQVIELDVTLNSNNESLIAGPSSLVDGEGKCDEMKTLIGDDDDC